MEYLRLAALLFSAPDVKSVLDVAAGAHWHFPEHYKVGYGLNVTGIDVDEEGLQANKSLDQFVVGDVCKSEVLGAGNYDLITCYSGIEHFPNVEEFLKNAYASLRDGGALIAQFPSPLAPFVILNRVVPQNTKNFLIKKLNPMKVTETGYQAFYDRCGYSAFQTIAKNSGFRVEYYLPSFMSSGYFYPVTPLFIISQFLDYFRLIFCTKNMSSYNLFILRRPGKHFQIKWSWHSV